MRVDYVFWSCRQVVCALVERQMKNWNDFLVIFLFMYFLFVWGFGSDGGQGFTPSAYKYSYYADLLRTSFRPYIYIYIAFFMLITTPNYVCICCAVQPPVTIIFSPKVDCVNYDSSSLRLDTEDNLCLTYTGSRSSTGQIHSWVCRGSIARVGGREPYY